MRSDACVGVLLVELHFPGNRSLKDKRAPLAHLRDALHSRFRASFSEVGALDKWQLARVLIVVAASSLQQTRERLDDMDRFLHGQQFEVARVLLKSADPVDTLWDMDG